MVGLLKVQKDLLNKDIYEYLIKSQYKQTAESLVIEAEIDL